MRSLVLLIPAIFLAMTLSAETHPFNVHDLVTMERISEPQVSPDGKTLAFVLRVTDLEANKGRTSLWAVGTDGNGLRQLTRPAKGNDSNPRWAPDGQGLFFLSTRSGSSQVWQLPVSGGEARQLSDLPLDVSSLVVSPDGRHLAVSIDVYVDCEDLACTAKKVEEREQGRPSGMVFDRLFVRHWDTWNDGRRGHVFVMPAAGGTAVDVCRGLDADAPPKPFGGAEEITFTPDSQAVVFSARGIDSPEAWSTDFDLYLAPVDGSQPPRNLTPENKAVLSQPAFSPDGKTLAYLAMARPGYEADRLRLVTRPWPEGPARVVTEAWDRSLSRFAFAKDGKKVFAVADDIGQQPLFSIDLASGNVSKLVAEGHVQELAVTAGHVYFGLNNLRMPVELFSVPVAGGEARQLTHVNAERLAATRMGKPEQFSFTGAAGDTVYGWVVTPADFDPAQKYPVAFLIHGGPQGSFGNDFHYRWNPQTYAGAGYAVVTVDFHGSTGYGQAFTDAINNDWGGKPLEDLQKGLAAALERYPWLDGDRVGALGASYGGYMISWIAGQWPDRFKCLVNHDGIFDQRMMYYATEELWFPEWEHGGPYYQRAEAYERENPAHFADRWKTPMLVIHGGLDFRIPLTQGLASFTALQRQGVESRLVIYPDENHWVLKPLNSIQWHDEVNAWLDRFLKK